MTSIPPDPHVLAWAESRCRKLYSGDELAHRSCGVAMAETFGRDPRSYQALRRGGLTGAGTCGALQGGLLVLGEVFGSPKPTAPATPELVRAAARYQDLTHAWFGNGRSTVCHDLTSEFADFRSPERHQWCTEIASSMARIVATVICELGGSVEQLPEPKT